MGGQEAVLLRPILLTLPLLVLLAVFAVTSHAQAASSVTFTSTADFNAGQKTNTETVSDPCSSAADGTLTLYSSMDYQGIGANCTSGSRAVTSGLLASYDFHTMTSGKLKDFSGNAKDCSLFSVTNGTGVYGGSLGFDGNAQYASCPTLATPAGGFSWHLEIFVNTTAFRLPLSLDTAGFTYLAYGISPNKFTCSVRTTISNYGVDTAATVSTGAWHSIDCVFNSGNSTINVYVDGVWSAKTSTAGTPQTWDNFHFGNFVSSLFWGGMIDEASIWNRALSAADIGHLATDGRASFVTSGSWISAVQSGTHNPGLITLTYSGVSSTSVIPMLQLRTAAGILFWTAFVNISSGTAFAILPAYPVSSAAGNWTVGLTLASDSVGSPVVLSVIVNLESASVSTATLDTNTWIFIFLGVAYLAFLGFGLGFGVSQDNALWLLAGLIPAGMIMLFLSFHAWNVTQSIFPSLALAMLAIMTIAYPIVVTLRGMLG